jgi:Arc/MetJ family transcription regulator
MRTTLDIDEQLVMQAMKETGAESREAVVEMALRLLLDHEARKRGVVRGQVLEFAQAPKRPTS